MTHFCRIRNCGGAGRSPIDNRDLNKQHDAVMFKKCTCSLFDKLPSVWLHVKYTPCNPNTKIYTMFNTQCVFDVIVSCKKYIVGL